MPHSSPEQVGWISDSSEPAGEPSPSPRSTPTPRRSSPSDGRESPTSGTSPMSLTGGGSDSSASQRVVSAMGLHPTISSSWGGTRPGVLIGEPPPSTPVASPAKTSASQASDGASPENAPASPSPSLALWSDTDLPPSSSRTFRASSPVMAAAILGHSSVRWANSGMGGPTGFLTLATSECRSADGECSSSVSTLASILQESVPQRFFLSARAAAGILRRASRRGRELPSALESALLTLSRQVAPGADASTATGRRSSTPVLLTMREGKPGGGKGPLLSEDQSLTLATENGQTLFDGPSVRRLTPIETERLMGWPDGHTIVAGWPTKASSKPSTPRAGDRMTTKPKRNILSPRSSSTDERESSTRRPSRGARDSRPPLTQPDTDPVQLPPSSGPASVTTLASPSDSTPTDTDAAGTAS
jgi:hypothetical protein